jgi:hypothetical protein
MNEFYKFAKESPFFILFIVLMMIQIIRFYYIMFNEE